MAETIRSKGPATIREDEAKQKVDLSLREKDAWPAKPVVSDYCGLLESKKTYLVAELKNPSTGADGRGACNNHSSVDQRRGCKTCRHRVSASGMVRDRTIEDLYFRLGLSARLTGGSDSSANSYLNSHRENIGHQIAYEFRLAGSRRTLPALPKYLDYCSLKSGPKDFVVCLLENSSDRCGCWCQ